MAPDWELARALLGGTRSMRAAGRQHLPQWPNEEPVAYACRLATAVLFPAYQRTVTTLTGKPFSKAITLGDDVPPQIVEWAQDIDLQGRNLDTFTADVMESALGYGICGMLVEYPTKPEGVKTVADEIVAGLRPYLIHIHPWQVLGWRAARRNGAWMLLQLRLMECVEEPDGYYGSKEVQQVRELSPGEWITYRQDDKKEWQIHEAGKTTLSYIPYVPVYGQRTGFMTGKPPLIEVAHLNVAHWQSASDQQTILHVARVPILTVIGIDDDKWSMTVGASAAVKLPLGGDMKFVEHSGAAISAGRDDLKDLEERMRQAGAELLVTKQRVEVTATQVAAENEMGKCALQRIAKGLEDAIDQALQIMAEWVGLPEGGHITLFDDFGSDNLSDASAQIVLAMQQGGIITKETAIREQQRRGNLSADIVPEDELAAVEGEGPALGMLGDPLAAPAQAASGGAATAPGAPGANGEPGAAAPAVAVPAPAAVLAPAADDMAADSAAIDAMQASIDGIAAQVAELLARLSAAPQVQQVQPAPVFNITQPAITVNTPEHPAPVVNVTSAPITVNTPDVNVAAPSITVNVPEQPAAQINIAPAAITVNTPDVNVAAPAITVTAPTVNVTPAPINVAAPTINVTPPAPPAIPATRDIKFRTNSDGEITGATVS